MPSSVIILIILFVILVSFLFFSYKKLIEMNKITNSAWTEISFQLKRRANLIPELVEILKKNLKDEADLTGTFSGLELKLVGARSIQESSSADKSFTDAFSRLILISESVPDLKNNKSFEKLIFEFLDIEEEIQPARRKYNSCARELNSKLEKFPIGLINRTVGHFPKRKLYGLKELNKKAK